MTTESDTPGPGAAARPDVAALLAEVEASVAAKKAQGFYREVDVRRVEDAAVRLQPALDEAQAEVTARHAALVELWDAKACGITTHRTGVVGRLLVGVKRLVHRLTAPYVNIVLARQTAFNVELVALLSALIPQHADVRLRLEEAERRIEELEDAAEQAATRPRSADGA
jgi:O-antigen chain-terminating methyltransferase